MNEQELLQKEYELVINQNDPWYFFLNLSNYVLFVKESQTFKKAVEGLEKEKEIRIKELLNLESKCVSELKASKKKLEAIIKKTTGLRETLKKTDPISDGLTSIDLYLEGRLHTGGTVSDILNRFLSETAWDLQSLNQGSLLKPFVVEKGGNQIVIFSKILQKRQELSKSLDNDRNISPWGYWDFMTLLLNREIFSNDMSLPKVDNVDQSLVTEYIHLKWEIMDSRKDDSFPHQQKKKLSHKESKVENFKHYLSRIHLFLLREITKEKDTKVELSLDFNPETSRLSILDKSISFRKLTDQYHVLNTIFSERHDLGREWFFSELGEKMDQYKKYKDKNFHNYLSAINRRIATETGLKDVFLTNTQSVKINTKYLK